MASQMTIEKACEILQCFEEEDKKSIKKKYRRLIQQVHPDTSPDKNVSMYSIHEVIEAYNLLMQPRERKKEVKHSTRTRNWDAKENESAYTVRKIFQNVEDYDGSVMGMIEVDCGKFMWTEEEDFPLFLKSIYECSKDLLTNFEYEERIKKQPQLSFLLAQQFIDGFDFIDRFTKKEADDIYFVPAMLEQTSSAYVRAGMMLYPKAIKNHRLFLQNKSGNEVGYLSFKDDRLYYCLIPLFEQKRAQVKMQVSQKQDRYKNVDLWIKIIDADTNAIMENLNSQIERLLKEKQR